VYAVGEVSPQVIDSVYEKTNGNQIVAVSLLAERSVDLYRIIKNIQQAKKEQNSSFTKWTLKHATAGNTEYVKEETDNLQTQSQNERDGNAE